MPIAHSGRCRYYTHPQLHEYPHPHTSPADKRAQYTPIRHLNTHTYCTHPQRHGYRLQHTSPVDKHAQYMPIVHLSRCRCYTHHQQAYCPHPYKQHQPRSLPPCTHTSHLAQMSSPRRVGRIVGGSRYHRQCTSMHIGRCRKMVDTQHHLPHRLAVEAVVRRRGYNSHLGSRKLAPPNALHSLHRRRQALRHLWGLRRASHRHRYRTQPDSRLLIDT